MRGNSSALHPPSAVASKLPTALLRCALAFFRSRNEQAIVELALRQQLATYAQKKTKPRLTLLDRTFWVTLFPYGAKTQPTVYAALLK